MLYSLLSNITNVLIIFFQQITIKSSKFNAMSDEEQLLKENGTVNINAIHLWKLLHDVINSEEHVRAYREYLELYLKIKCANKTERHYFLGVGVKDFSFHLVILISCIL